MQVFIAYCVHKGARCGGDHLIAKKPILLSQSALQWGHLAQCKPLQIWCTHRWNVYSCYSFASYSCCTAVECNLIESLTRYIGDWLNGEIAQSLEAMKEIVCACYMWKACEASCIQVLAVVVQVYNLVVSSSLPDALFNWTEMRMEVGCCGCMRLYTAMQVHSDACMQPNTTLYVHIHQRIYVYMEHVLHCIILYTFAWYIYSVWCGNKDQRCIGMLLAHS